MNQFKRQYWSPLLNAPVPIFLTLYTLALMTSMSGMEIFGWGACALTLVYIFIVKVSKLRDFRLFRLGVEVPLVGLILVAYLGLKFNAPDVDPLEPMGKLRWILMLYLLTFAFEVAPILNRLLNTLIAGGTLVGIYAIYQHFTGIDLVRGDNRAVTIAPFEGAEVFSNTGFLSHHLTYGYSFSMIICFSFAAFLLGRKKPWYLRLGFLMSVVIIGMSLIWTYGRGVWLATALSFLLMVSYVSRKHLIGFLLLMGLAGGIVYQTSPGLRERAQSVWDSGYFSNDDRRAVWKANYEMFLDHPWMGVGYTQNEALLGSYYEKLGLKKEFGGHAHNNYLQMLSTTGILGFICYTLFILSFLLMTHRLWTDVPETHFWHRVLVLGALGAQISLHTGGITQWNFGDAENTHVFIFILAIVAYMSERYARGIVPDDYSL
jgi:putative inorganic carbon (HCO3(-)) transporter